jgi:hypothetical protein
VAPGRPKEGIRFAWRHRCSGFFDCHAPALYAHPAVPKALPESGGLEGKGCGTLASSSSIHLGVSFVHGFSMSGQVVSCIYGHKRSGLHAHFLMVFQTSLVAPMTLGDFSPWFLSFAPWGHRSPRGLHAGKWKSTGDLFLVVFCSCSSPLTSVVLPSHRKSNGHDEAIWTSSAPYIGIAYLQMHGLVRR